VVGVYAIVPGKCVGEVITVVDVLAIVVGLLGGMVVMFVSIADG
jgi:hypothetical protein